MRLYVPLTRDEFEDLREIARAERRRPQEQAAFLLAERLRRLRCAADLTNSDSLESEHRADQAAAMSGAK